MRFPSVRSWCWLKPRDREWLILVKTSKISTVEIEAILNTPDGKLKQSKDKFLFYKKLKGQSDNMLAAVSVVENIYFYEIMQLLVP